MAFLFKEALVFGLTLSAHCLATPSALASELPSASKPAQESEPSEAKENVQASSVDSQTQATAGDALTNYFSLGGGYYGESFFHPGISIEGGFDWYLSKHFAISSRIDSAWYYHRRNHQALIFEASTGLRVDIGHASLGALATLGPMLSWNATSDGTYEVNGDEVEKVSNFIGTNLLVGVGPELSWRIPSKSHRSRHRIWTRVLAKWQLSVNNGNLLHVATGIGYAYEFSVGGRK